MTYVTIAEAPTAALPGTAVFVSWDGERRAFQLEDHDDVITIADDAALLISGISTEPVGRRAADGGYTIAYLAEPAEEVFSVVEIALDSAGGVETITQTRFTGYGHGEALLATLRGSQDAPDSQRFLLED
jgi:hypothetical protein